MTTAIFNASVFYAAFNTAMPEAQKIMAHVHPRRKRHAMIEKFANMTAHAAVAEWNKNYTHITKKAAKIIEEGQQGSK